MLSVHELKHLKVGIQVVAEAAQNEKQKYMGRTRKVSCRTFSFNLMKELNWLGHTMGWSYKSFLSHLLFTSLRTWDTLACKGFNAVRWLFTLHNTKQILIRSGDNYLSFLPVFPHHSETPFKPKLKGCPFPSNASLSFSALHSHRQTSHLANSSGKKSWVLVEQGLFSTLYPLSLQNSARLSHLTAKLIFHVCPFLACAMTEIPCFFQILGYMAQVLLPAQLTHYPSPKQLTQIKRMAYKDQTKNAELWARSQCLKAVNTLAARNTETFGPPRHSHQKALRWMLPSPPSSTVKEKWWSDFFLRLTWHCSIKNSKPVFWNTVSGRDEWW